MVKTAGGYSNLVAGTDYTITTSSTNGAPIITYTDSAQSNLTYNENTLLLREAYNRIYPVIRSSNLISLNNGSYSIQLQAPTLSASSTYILPSSVGTTGQVLTASNGTGTLTWCTISAGSSALSALTDVTISTLLNNQVLNHNTSSSKWLNITLSSSLLSDFNILTPSNNDILQYNSATKWLNVSNPNTSVSKTVSSLTQNQQIVTSYTDGTDGYIISYDYCFDTIKKEYSIFQCSYKLIVF